MQIAVISDLHLGAGDRSDRFGHEDHRFLAFLDHLESNFERIVLLGDIWETLTPQWAGDFRGALRKAREAHPAIAARFERPRYTYIHGNHDIVAGLTERVPEELALEANGIRLLFTHGHHHDVLLRRARWLSELGVWLGGWLLRFRLRWLWSFFDRWDQNRSGALLDGTRCAFQKWAVGLARQREADVVVTGHTHLPVRSDHGDRLFLNSGSCADGRFSFLALDTRTARFAVEDNW